MAKKKHIPLFDDQLEMLELLTDQEVGQAVLAAMRFMRSGTETDLTGGAGVVYQVLRASSSGTRTTPPSGKRAGVPGKAPPKPRFRKPKPLNGTKRNRTEPDRTEQNRTRRNRTGTGGGDGSAGGRFVPPTLDEVRAYVLQRRSPVEPQAFIDFYQARGWMVGKAPMRDWKAACRSAESWERWSRPPAQTQVTNPDRIAKYVDW